MKASARPEAWQAYLQRYVLVAATPHAYLDALGGARLSALAVSETTLA